jgi:hypothetical protein
VARAAFQCAMGQGNERGVVTTTPGTNTITNVQMSPLPRLVLNDGGIKIRNGLLVWRIGWDQVRLITDGSWRGRWALRIERLNGRAVTCTATADVDGKHPGRPEMVAAIREAAQRHDIPTALTGPPEWTSSAPTAGPELEASGPPAQQGERTAVRYRLALGSFYCGIAEVGLVTAEIATHRKLAVYLTILGWLLPFALFPANYVSQLAGSDERTKQLAKYASIIGFIALIAWVIATGNGSALNNAG